MLDRKDAYSAIPQLEKKIDAISTAQEEAGLNYDAFREETRQELEVISGEIVGVVTNMLQIESSNGLIFKEGIETTQLNVTIYRGSEVISNYEQLTAQLGYTAYLRWSYLTDTGYVEIPVSDSRLSNDSFTLTLSTADVAEKTTFKCELMLEGSGNLAELLAANQITIAKVLDGEMSAEQLAQLNQASTDASQAKTDAKEAADLADSKVGISNYYSDKEILNNTIDGINTAIYDINSTTNNLSSVISKELVFNGFANFTSEPKLTLGKTTSEWKVVVTNDGIFLQKSSNDVASLSKETSSEETTLRADNARLANVKFRSANGGGKLGIVAQSNGHVSLKEI